jgi:hypothetical protein
VPLVAIAPEGTPVEESLLPPEFVANPIPGAPDALSDDEAIPTEPLPPPTTAQVP